jgi:hypothetical protein
MSASLIAGSGTALGDAAGSFTHDNACDNCDAEMLDDARLAPARSLGARLFQRLAGTFGFALSCN